MPNNIKNRIVINGTDEEIKKFVDTFSTIHKRTERKTYDGEIICQEKNGSFVGWYNEDDNTFKYSKDRGTEIKTKGIPDSVEYEYREEFIQMPDFEQIIPTPESLKGTEFHSEIITRAKNAMGIKVNENDLISRLEKSNRIRDCFTPINEKDIDDVIKSIKAYKESGFFYWYDWNSKNWGTKWNSYSCENPEKNIYIFETAWCGVPDLIKKMSDKFESISIDYLYADEDSGCNTGDMIIKSGEIIENKSPKNESNRAYEIYLELNPDCEYIKMIDGKYQYIEDDE